MKTAYTLPAIFTACALTLSPLSVLAQTETDPSPSIPEKTAPSPVLTDDELSWIENKCKLQHPMSDENREKCMMENKQKKLDEKTMHGNSPSGDMYDNTPADNSMPKHQEMPRDQ